MTVALPNAERQVRCAIYTHRSVDKGIDGEFNSLYNQRDMCSAYIRSQRHQGWVEIADRYDDDGVSGGTMIRPGLKQLFADIHQGLVDNVVIYKLDRLTRSLSDFMRLIEMFDKFGVAFVCVTQSFDTRDSMGRLVLNILLTFAQFEREISADRARDRMMSLAKRGCWTGGRVPIGYDVAHGRLIINPLEAATVREAFERFVVQRSCRGVADELRKEGHRTKAGVNARGLAFGGNEIHRHSIYQILGGAIYVGDVSFKGTVYPGIHEPIVSRELWDAVQAVRAEISNASERPLIRKNLLVGLFYDGLGRRMLIHSPRRNGHAFRYYVSASGRSDVAGLERTLRVDGDIVEALVKSAITLFLRNRFELSGAMLKRDLHDEGVEALLDNGPVAARRLEAMEHDQLRLTYEYLIRRVETTRETVRVILGCDEILRFLAWDGFGLLQTRPTLPKARETVHILEFGAQSVRTEKAFGMPVRPRDKELQYTPNRKLVALLAKARAIHEMVHNERDLSLSEIAKRHNQRPAYIARVLRLIYLAPDIQTAILDGRQPPAITSKRLLHGPFPMDWPQQRTLLGFPPQPDLMDGSSNYWTRRTAMKVNSME